MDPRRIFGNTGEELAATFLQSKGLRVLHSQYTTRYGEIDLICQDGDEVVFVEVKSRATTTYGYPEEAITNKKIGHILRVAHEYLGKNQYEGAWRIDVVAIEFHLEPPRIVHLENIDIPETFW